MRAKKSSGYFSFDGFSSFTVEGGLKGFLPYFLICFLGDFFSYFFESSLIFLPFFFLISPKAVC